WARRTASCTRSDSGRRCRRACAAARSWTSFRTTCRSASRPRTARTGGATCRGSTELSADRLGRLLRDAPLGGPPPPDMEIETLRRVPGAVAAVVAFTGHVVVAADVGPGWVAGRCPPGDLVGPFRPEFLADLFRQCGCGEFSPTVTLALPPGADPGREAP